MRWGLWRGIGVIRFDSLSLLACLLPEAGCRPGGRLTFFASPKKVSKERRPLLSASLRCAAGNLRCSTPAGVRRTRFAQTAAALIPPPSALLGAYRRGGSGQPSLPLGPETNSQYQPPRRAAPGGWWPSDAKARSVSKPLCVRRGAQGFADQGSQLFERSEFCEAPRNPSTAGCPQRSGGTQTVGSPFFCLRFFGEAKKSRSPAGASPGLGTQTPDNGK